MSDTPEYLLQIEDEMHGYWDTTILNIDLARNKPSNYVLWERQDAYGKVFYVKTDVSMLDRIPEKSDGD